MTTTTSFNPDLRLDVENLILGLADDAADPPPVATARQPDPPRSTAWVTSMIIPGGVG
jgi:hypothetical protein